MVENCIFIRFFLVIYENYSMSRLSIRGNDFIAHWVYAERIIAYAQQAFKFRQFLHGHPNVCWVIADRIASLAAHISAHQPTRKWLKFHLGRIENDFQKSRVTAPWDQRIRFLQKSRKNFRLVYLSICILDYTWFLFSSANLVDPTRTYTVHVYTVLYVSKRTKLMFILLQNMNIMAFT
jgi:hypothetical protein